MRVACAGGVWEALRPRQHPRVSRRVPRSQGECTRAARRLWEKQGFRQKACRANRLQVALQTFCGAWGRPGGSVVAWPQLYLGGHTISTPGECKRLVCAVRVPATWPNVTHVYGSPSLNHAAVPTRARCCARWTCTCHRWRVKGGKSLRGSWHSRAARMSGGVHVRQRCASRAHVITSLNPRLARVRCVVTPCCHCLGVSCRPWVARVAWEAAERRLRAAAGCAHPPPRARVVRL